MPFLFILMVEYIFSIASHRSPDCNPAGDIIRLASFGSPHENFPLSNVDNLGSIYDL